MIDLRSILLAPALGLGASLLAQEATPPAAAPRAQSAPEAKAESNTDQLIRDLGSESYRTRTAAERALRARGKDALPALEKAAADGGDGEVQWRAKRLVRQIQDGSGGAAVERPRGRDGDAPAPQVDRGEPFRPGRADPFGGDMRGQFESLFERFERDFGVDIPRARFFDDDFFKDLQDQLRNGAGQGQSQGMSMRVGPDGVHVEVQQRNAKGELETKTYDAPDMDTFQKQYPDVLRRNGLGMGLDPLRLPTLRGFDFGTPAPRLWGGMPNAEPATPSVVPSAGRRLGVTVRPEIAAELRDYLGLAADEGLMVDSVQPGSLAEALGLTAGDIVTRIGDTKVGSPTDVAEALGAIEKGKQVTVHFVHKGAEKTASAEKTEAVEEPQGKARPRLEPARPRSDGKVR